MPFGLETIITTLNKRNKEFIRELHKESDKGMEVSESQLADKEYQRLKRRAEELYGIR